LPTSLDDLEARLTGRTLAWVGGLALILGAIFFLSLAFTRGWIGPELRVLIGLVAGAAGITGGAILLGRGNRLLGHVITAVGLGIVSVSLAAATDVYHLIPAEAGLLLALITAIATAAIAIHVDGQAIAAFGLIAVLLAPPLTGAPPDLLTLAFVAVVLIGTTGVALWRSWTWLPPTAFALSAPQAAVWIGGHPEPAIALGAIGLFWLLNIVAAGGEEFRRHRDDLSPSSTTLLLANVAFTLWAGFTVLGGDLVAYRGAFLVLLALAEFAVGGYFLVRDGDRNLFGLLTLGTGLAALTMAAPIQLGGPAVPMAWAAEAAALAWVAARRGHPYSAIVSVLLYALAGIALIAVYARPFASPTGVPFIDGPGLSLGFFLAAVAVGICALRDRALRSGLAAGALLVAAVCSGQALDAVGSTVAWSLLTGLGVSTWRLLPLLPGEPIAWRLDGLLPTLPRDLRGWRRNAERLLPGITVLLATLATLSLVGPVSFADLNSSGRVPFIDPLGLALVSYLAMLAITAWLSRSPWLREPLAALGLLVIAWTCLFELDGVWLVAALSALMPAGLAVGRGLASLPDALPRRALRTFGRRWTLDATLSGAALISGALAGLHVLLVELPVTDFGNVLPPHVPFTDAGAAAAAILMAAVLLSGSTTGVWFARRISIFIAIGIAAYTVPFEVYAWAVCVLWVGLGGLALVLARFDRMADHLYRVVDGGLIVGSALVAAVVVAPAQRLQLTPSVDVVILVQSAAALGAVALGLVALAREARAAPWSRWVWSAAGVTLVYLLSVAIVDAFALRVGGPVSLAELRTQAQVALSVLWAGLGVVAFMAGLWFRLDDLRRGGLILLAAATAKAFLFDLAALDVAYRVVSLIALGLLLLASAWLWQRLGPGPIRPDDAEAHDPTTSQPTGSEAERAG
jgi:Predicted membrane protein (DUF2339)